MRGPNSSQQHTAAGKPAGWCVGLSGVLLLLLPLLVISIAACMRSGFEGLPTAHCGNSLVEAGEECDDGNSDPCDGCLPNCKMQLDACDDQPVCGNQRTESGEECDDGRNGDDCDGCLDDCTTHVNICGDTYQCGTKECDDGRNGDDCDGCLDDCTLQSVPCHCHDILAFGDDFDDGLFGTGWDALSTGSANHSELSGVVRLNLNTPGPGHSILRTLMTYDFRNRHVSVEIDSMVEIRADSSASFRVLKPSSPVNDLSIVQQNGTLRAAYTQDGTYTIINQVAYIPAQHRFWRLRDLDSVAFWETSGDGLQWQTLAKEPTPFDVERIYVELSAQTTSSISAAETLLIDLLGQNGSGALSICNAPGWVDDFEDQVADANWSTYGDAYLQESGGELLITAPVNQVGYGGYQTSTRFSLLDSAVWVKLAQPLNAATGAEADLIIAMDDYNALYLSVQGDPQLVTIYCRHQSSSSSVLHTLAYDPAQHVYLKIAERDGTIYWYTSADGFIYTQLYALPNPFTGAQRLDDVSAIIQAGTWQNVAAPGQAHFDDFGLPY